MHNCTTPQTSETDDEPSPKKGKKRGLKMKRPPNNQAMSNAKAAAIDSDNRQQMAPPQPQQIQIIPITSQGQGHSQGQQEKRALEARVMEISPFESTPTFKCVFCPKRSQQRERMERHVAQEHPGRDEQPGYKQMSRDQGC